MAVIRKKVQILEKQSPTKPPKSKWWLWLLLSAAVIVVIAVIFFIFIKEKPPVVEEITTSTSVNETSVNASETKQENSSVAESAQSSQSADADNTPATATTPATAATPATATTTAGTAQTPLQGSVDEKARSVIRGDFGNGAERKQKLGDEYQAIQKRVNEMYRDGMVN